MYTWFKSNNRVKASIFLFLLLIGAVTKITNAEDCFIVAPYVLHVTDESVQVVWVTPAGTDAGMVIVEKTDKSGQQAIAAELSNPLFQDRNADEMELDHLRQLVKVQGLESYTRYNYEVRCGDGETTSSGTFLTAPVPGDRHPIDFVVGADAHGMGRYSQIAEQVGALKPGFVIHAGDLRGGLGHDWGRWRGYFNLARPYLENSVFVPVVGGHDVRPARNFRSLFAFNDPKSNPSEEDNAGTYYSFEYGNLLVVILDHVYDFDDQLIWVEDVLSESEAEWIIVSTHESPVNVGGRGYWLRNDFYRDLAVIFEKYGVDFVITGHDHIYERNLPLGSEGVKPVNYVAINSSGNHRRVRPSPIVAGGIGKNSFMYTHFRINGNKLEMKAIDNNGRVIDQLKLVKNDEGMYQNEIMEKAVDLELAQTLAHIYTGQSVVEDLRYVRRDIEATFKLSVPIAGAEGVLKLNTGYSGDHERDVSRFPIGSELIVYAQDDPKVWQTEKQVVEVTENTTEVIVRAPDGLIYDENGLSIPLQLSLNISINGREFEQVTVRPTLTETGKVGDVQLVQPSNIETVISRPVLKWEEALHANDYQLQVGKPNLSKVIIDTLLSDTRYEVTEKLEEGKSYTWRVRGINKFEGPWSNEYVFHIYRETSSGDIDEISFSNDLRPAYTALELSEVSAGNMGSGFRGKKSIFTWIESDQPLKLGVTGGTISHFRDRGNVRISLLSYHQTPPEKVDFDDSVPPDGERYEVVLESPYEGLHELEWDDGNDRTYLSWANEHLMTIRASKSHPFRFPRNFSLYFYVPDGTEVVGGYVDHHSRVRFFDAEGNERSGWQNSVENEGYFSIPVPQGQDGKLWRIASNWDVTLSLMTVPPYLALNERQLLLPVEVLNYSETKSPEPIGDRILINGDFSDGLESWTSFTAEYASVSADITVLGGEAAITNIAGAVGEVSHVQFNQELTAGQIKALEVGSNYIIKFDARSDVDGRQLRLFFGEAGGDFTPLNITDLELSSDMETYEAVFEVDQTFGSMKLGFEMGHSNDDVIIDNVSLAQTDKNLPTSADHEMFDVPMAFQLRQNYPNPFNPTTQIQFDIPEQSEVTLELFTVMGQRVATLASGEYHPGQHTVEFDATNLASGMYIYRLQAGSFTQTKKMMLIK